MERLLPQRRQHEIDDREHHRDPGSLDKGGRLLESHSLIGDTGESFHAHSEAAFGVGFDPVKAVGLR